MPQLGDIIISKQGKTLLVLAQTDSIIENLLEILPTREPILITTPIRFTHFTKEGFLIVSHYSSLQKPMIIEYYNREYLYESEVKKEIGFVTNSKILSDIANLMKNETINLREQHGVTRAKNICRTLLQENSKFQLELRSNNPEPILYN